MHDFRISGNGVHISDDTMVPAGFQDRSSESFTLPYAPPPPKSRGFVARASVAILVIGATLILIHQAPVMWRRLQIMYLQSRCLSFDPPPGQVVLALAEPRPQYFLQAVGPCRIPPEWDRLNDLLLPTRFKLHGTVFLHQLTSPSGHRRLVALDLSWGASMLRGSTVTQEIGAWPLVLVPGTLVKDPVVVSDPPSASDPYIRFDASGGIVRAANLDPLDPSHFWFQAEQKVGIMRVDEWLRDDDTIAWQERGVQAADPYGHH